MSKLPLLERARMQKFALVASRISGAAHRKANGLQPLQFDADAWDQAGSFAQDIHGVNLYFRSEQGLSPARANAIDALPTAFRALHEYLKPQDPGDTDGFIVMLQDVLREPSPSKENLETVGSFFGFLSSCLLSDLAGTNLPRTPERLKLYARG